MKLSHGFKSLAHLAVVISFFVVIACAKEHSESISDSDIVSDDSETLILNEPDKSCLYQSFFSKLDNFDSNTKESAFKLLENHEINRDGSCEKCSEHAEIKEIYKTLDLNNKNCKSECSDVGSHAVYESIFAKNILRSDSLNKPIAKVLYKVLNSLKNQMNEKYRSKGDAFEISVQNWLKNRNKKIAFPVIQKQIYRKKTPPSKYPTTELYLKSFLSEEDGNFGFQLDYLMFNAKSADQFGILQELKEERDYYFNAIVRRLRGYRGNRPEFKRVNRKHYGIARFDVAELEMPKDAYGYSWLHWARDACINDAEGSLYSRTVTQLSIPLACGISGTTNMLLWSLFFSKAELDENEMRLFLLATWAVLCADGGHSLQEVLTSAKILSQYLKEVIQHNDTLKNNISMKTLDVLVAVTKKVSAITVFSENKASIGDGAVKVSENLKSKAYDSPGIHESKVSDLSDGEKNIRIELETYILSHAESGEQFGKYFDSFFSNIKDPNFWSVREASQVEFQAYFNKYCSK
jgi:hypothetical protein